MNSFVLITVTVALFSAQAECGKRKNTSQLTYEPQFEYQMDVLQRLLDLKTENENVREALGEGTERIEELVDQLEASYGTISQLNTTVNILRSQNLGSGSTYTRWGRTTCDGDATVVYEGFMAGAYYTHAGSGSNYLCLTNKPQWGVYDDRAETKGLIYGVEYEIGGDQQDHDAPCVVCSVPRSTVLMTPGTNECEEGWNLEYWGYLASQAYNQQAKQFICLDQEPESLEAGTGSLNGALLYHVEGRCGSLACPPYVNYRELTCVVCSYGKQRG